MSCSLTRAALSGAILLIVVAPVVATAQSTATTAIAPFEGRRARPLQRAVRQVLDDDAELVDDDGAAAAAERAGVAGTGADGVPAMASDVGADLIVQGEVSGPNRAPRVDLVIRAADGEELARGEARYRRGRAARRAFQRAVRQLYEGAIAALDAHRAAARAAEPIEAPPPEEEVAEEAPPAAVPDDGLALFDVRIGLSVRTREATIDLENGRQRRYEVATGAYPEIALAAEARPFANDAHLGRGLFVRASFGHSAGLGSESEDGTVQVTTNFVRFALDAGWLAPIGDAVELGLGLGVGYDGYFLSANPVLPTAEYVSVRPAVRGRFRLAQETAVLEVEAAYRGVAGSGDIRGAFGADGDTHGFDVGVGIGGNLHQIAGLGFSWSLRFDYVGYVMSFDGAATDVPGTNGTENAVLVTALIGWSFR